MAPNWFIAFPIDAGNWFAPWIARAPETMRLFGPSDLHITLAFLGGVGEDLARVSWKLLLENPPEPCARASFGPVEAFGHPKRPSAYALTLDEGREAVCAAMLRLTSPLKEAAGGSPEVRPPRPHCTVFRPPRKATPEEREAAQVWADSTAPPAHRFSISSVALYTWSDDRKKTQFKIVEQLELLNLD